jgi:hypothetical protein
MMPATSRARDRGEADLDDPACDIRVHRKAHGVTVGVLVGHFFDSSDYCLSSSDRSLIELCCDRARGDHASAKVWHCRKGCHQLDTLDPRFGESGSLQESR